MAYVTRLVGKEEKLIGIARLHYIYVLRGASWLLSMSLLGLGLSYLMGMGLGSMAAYFDTMSEERAIVLTGILLNLQHYTMLFCVGVGAMFFLMYLIKFLVTEIALTSRRIIHKEGWIFVDVRQLDLEEIRGENLDTGVFGRMLNYGYLLLDSRFLGDVKLPAVAKAEAFLKALHYHRAHTQDAVSVVVGKGNPAPVEIISANQAISNGPAVEVRSENQTAIHSDSNVPVSAVQEATHEAVKPVQMAEPQQPPQQPPQTPLQPPATPQTPVPEKAPPQPQQPPAQPPIDPPAQPQPEIVPPREIPTTTPPEIIPDPAPIKPEIQPPPQASAKGVDAEIVAQVVSQVVPEIVKEMADKGIINSSAQKPAGASVASPQGEEELLSAFDEAAFETKAKSVAENAKDKQVLH